MKFAIYLSPRTETEKCPVLCWLSGLTYTEQHFISKSGHHQAASEQDFVLIVSHTDSHRYSIKGEGENWDFGICAGFNVDANEDPWETNYTMCSFVTGELPQLVNANFPVDPQRKSIFGQAVGSLRALVCAFKQSWKM